jgi:hypothetical protein
MSQFEKWTSTRALEDPDGCLEEIIGGFFVWLIVDSRWGSSLEKEGII